MSLTLFRIPGEPLEPLELTQPSMSGKAKAPTSLGGASKASQRDPDVPAAVAPLDNYVFFEKHPQASSATRGVWCFGIIE